MVARDSVLCASVSVAGIVCERGTEEEEEPNGKEEALLTTVDGLNTAIPIICCDDPESQKPLSIFAFPSRRWSSYYVFILPQAILPKTFVE